MCAPSATVFFDFKRVEVFFPLAIFNPNEKLRDLSDEQVRNKSPSPDNPISVSGLPPSFLQTRLISAKLLEIIDATALSPNFLPVMIPHPIA